jgi:quercetin dioxygenase-like cupin family protein
VGDLLKVANVLGVSIGHFFQTRIPDKRVEVVRAAERWTVKARSEAGRALGYRYQSLSHGLTEKLMQPFLVEVPPADDAALNRSQHEGEEFLFVLGGVLEVEIGGERHRLEPGDSIYYDSRQPHTLRALEGVTARLIACIAQHPNVTVKSGIDRAYR